VTKN